LRRNQASNGVSLPLWGFGQDGSHATTSATIALPSFLCSSRSTLLLASTPLALSQRLSFNASPLCLRKRRRGAIPHRQVDPPSHSSFFLLLPSCALTSACAKVHAGAGKRRPVCHRELTVSSHAQGHKRVHTQHTHIATCSRTSHIYAHSQTHMYSHADHTRAHVLTGIDGPAKGSASNERVAFLTELELAVGNTASPSVLTAVRTVERLGATVEKAKTCAAHPTMAASGHPSLVTTLIAPTQVPVLARRQRWALVLEVAVLCVNNHEFPCTYMLTLDCLISLS
jgi:hypothetical protein